MIVGIIALMSAILLGYLVLEAEGIRQNETSASKDGLSRAKIFILDYVKKNKALPSVATFQTDNATLTDYWGRKILYFPSANLLPPIVNICTQTTGNASILNCGSDDTCASPVTTANIPFVLFSAGQVIKSTTDIAFQTTTNLDSVSLASASSFKQYKSGFNIGSYATPTTSRLTYDDLLLTSTFSEIYSAAGCLSNTQGDVQGSGGELKILNTDPSLPSFNCPTPTGYPKILSAYGRTGTYSWSILNLPAGLTYTPSGTSSTISGLPNVVDGTYPVTVTVTDSAGRSDFRSYSLAVSGCCNWTNTATVQSLSCAAGYTGSITQTQQSRSCDSSTQWITTSDTCTPTPPTPSVPPGPTATYNGRFSALLSEFSSGSTNSGKTSVTIGSGTDRLTISAISNITRHSTSSLNPAIGVAGGGGDALDQNQKIVFDFEGGYGRMLGIEFKGLQNDQGAGVDQLEEAIIVFKNTVTNTTITTLTIPACQSGSSNNSSYSLPDVGDWFNRVEVIANNSPATSDFFIRGLTTCDVGATSCYPAIPTGFSTNICP